MLTNGDVDMREHFVIDPLISKRQQLLLATQLCRMVLKVRIKPPSLPSLLQSCILAKHVYRELLRVFVSLYRFFSLRKTGQERGNPGRWNHAHPYLACHKSGNTRRTRYLCSPRLSAIRRGGLCFLVCVAPVTPLSHCAPPYPHVRSWM